jgi:hypothetical protein
MGCSRFHLLIVVENQQIRNLRLRRWGHEDGRHPPSGSVGTRLVCPKRPEALEWRSVGVFV